MRATRILIVGIALFGAACATATVKSVQGPGTVSGPQSDNVPGVGSERQGPSLNGDIPDGADASRLDGHATGSRLDTVRVVGGQLFSSARAHD